MAGLVGYGGDPAIVASRAEIERVGVLIAAVADRLLGGFFDFLPNPVHRAQVDIQVPLLLGRMAKTRIALAAAAENYFTADAQLAHKLEDLGNVIRDNPWLVNLIPKGAAAKIEFAGAVGFALAQVAPGATAANATRTLAATRDLEKDLSKANGVGLLVDRRVQFQAVSAEPQAEVHSLSTLGHSLAKLNTLDAQIRVETYVSPGGEKTLLVLLPSTQSMLPVASANPFDLTSDATLAINPEESELQEAVMRALASAGAREANVILAGYSLGGVLAANIASSNEFNVTGVVTIGSPVGHVEIPGQIPVLSLQHQNDPIPALTAATNPLTENWATATRMVELNLAEPAIKAHEFEHYEKSLALADTSTNKGVVRIRELILNQLSGSQLVSTQGFSFSR